MYREATKQINKGLSLGARVVIGVAALLTALVMLVPNTPPQNPVLVYSVAGFCLAIAVACFVGGRLRQFAGSCIGVGLFAVSLYYLTSELSEGKIISGSRSEPSALNALMFTFFFGFPGITYTVKAKFGFGKP